ncbi:MAG: hypothetical protein USCAAHI_00053 [Beijerinckiaceae bacterium]|nr:MAG: hypothetical protein USCAAHI_00053 [Beijerinckiaceae bacterium]
MGRRAVKPARDVFPGEDRGDARNGHGFLAADAENLCMRMGRAQHLEVQQSIHGNVQGIARRTGHDPFAEGVAQAGAAGLARDVLLGGDNAVDGVMDGAISRAPAQIALERVRQVGTARVIERGHRHDHASGAEAALECLGVEKGLLDRMQRAVGFREAFDGGDLSFGGTKGGHQAGMHGGAVEPDRAGAAIPGIAALLDAEVSPLAQEGPQALTGLRLGGKKLAIDRVVHPPRPGCASSARICSAK